MSLRRRIAWIAMAASVALVIAGCSAIQYYAQAVAGHLEVMTSARDVERRIAGEPDMPADLRARLIRALEMRAFASRELGLPDNGSYRSYADLGRPYVVWNVFAAPEFSIRPTQSCFPFAGCISYRGFYSEARANDHGDALRKDGLDVFVYGVAAYSTIGWFDDPLLNTFIHYPEPDLARLLFHELAHQVAYTKDDSVFNESFAVAVEEEGLRRWLARSGSADQLGRVQAARERRRDFVALVQKYQGLLKDLYAGSGDDAGKRAEKRRLFAAMRSEYEAIRQERWGGFAGYDRWFARDLNNAHLASVAIYEDLVPAFRALLAREEGDLPRFYAQAKRLAALPKAERDVQVQALVLR